MDKISVTARENVILDFFREILPGSVEQFDRSEMILGIGLAISASAIEKTIGAEHFSADEYLERVHKHAKTQLDNIRHFMNERKN